MARKLALIDANINRAREGLRVVEDISRFILEDKKITAKIKTIRHELSKTTNSAFDYSNLVFSRSSGKDVGQQLHTKQEHERKNLENILLANFLRVQEAVRVLEEFSKKEKSKISQKYKQVRYKLYELEETLLKEVKKYDKITRFKNTGLYVILDSRFTKESYESTTKKVLAARVKTIQLRDKTLSDKALLSKAKKIRKLTEQKNVLFIVNDRLDIAILSNADGVHLGQNNIPIKEAKKILKENMIIGFSTHSQKQAVQAVKEGADYISIGPIYPTKSKKHVKSVGLKLFEKVYKKLDIPIVAIGGITTDNISQVRKKGAKIIGVINSSINQKNITRATKKLMDKIKKR